ncbi:hypothetical protein V8J88_24180 [Massilia sp. W12]|uniref:Tse2 family ADP-ribosyltransferase toxin n=1 Tax=Massilia sp. W12 TaxID=3126507 RepID=UPI0030D19E22
MPDMTTVDLYRSCRIEQFPDGVMQDLEPSPGVLYPDFYPKPLEGGGERAPDVKTESIDGVEWVRSGGGTSLFDKKGIFTKPGWLSFEIPLGTPIPDSLVILNTGYNKRFKATHYQIESRARMMTKVAMQGALDNLARSAIARAVELGRVS